MTPKEAHDALWAQLRTSYDGVEKETRFDWLTVRPRADLRGPLAEIFDALCAARGHQNFATVGFQPSCDFVIRPRHLIIEYDERRHFTRLRAIALKLYPLGLALDFSRDRWIAECERIDANDNMPFFGDEQRAFYDSCRDLLAVENNWRLIRLRHRPNIEFTRPFSAMVPPN